MINLTIRDIAISSKPIPDSVWVLIFTRSGKYFFFNCKTGETCWIPPETVIKTLKEKFTPSKREMFFDPFYQGEEGEDDAGGDESEGNEIEGSEDDDHDTADTNNTDTADTDAQEQRNCSTDSSLEDEFKLYLLKNSVDPFAPWPTIISLHSSSPQFQAIKSYKRRQELFSQVCPLLIEQKREEGKRKLGEAKKWWDEVKEEHLKMGWQWFQVIKKIKGNSKFSFLNEKECEKEYKNLFNKRR